MTEVLYIAAKAPRTGVAKTRLGKGIGHEAAVALYKAFLQDLAARFTGTPFPVGWYVTPDDAWPDIRPLVCRNCDEPRVLYQGDGDWTGRQRKLFRDAAGRGEERTVLIASDSPQLGVEVIERAFRELEQKEVVLGPVADGGYYLIGLSRKAAAQDLLGGIQMSTDTVVQEISARAKSFGFSVGYLLPTFDVDEAADLDQLVRLLYSRADLPATRTVLQDLGLFGKPLPK